MENNSEILYKNSEKIHTTEMGIERIKRNRDLKPKMLLSGVKIKFLIREVQQSEKKKIGI